MKEVAKGGAVAADEPTEGKAKAGGEGEAEGGKAEIVGGEKEGTKLVLGTPTTSFEVKESGDDDDDDDGDSDGFEDDGFEDDKSPNPSHSAFHAVVWVLVSWLFSSAFSSSRHSLSP
eukprot:CAMPEP_0175072642 /NCGR_PEP_ID=MMETSP0052_2-20121109/20035_1 /TAXON_ID=51329 ORGANISM="Polytomella parva, Strain SAG 63-3" /NCGR_SAMPLE_ID=MMETSP0052_2 /ASSEMBLY_ACC=CAM_ASM_000194 /LENGTH=116 /DNA_ID=CAMNT_0016340193 /DNA_START=22 /DNA_END=368 /DNA_ORIENTATION=+